MNIGFIAASFPHRILGKQIFIIIDTCAGANLSQVIRLLNHRDMIKIVLGIRSCLAFGN